MTPDNSPSLRRRLTAGAAFTALVASTLVAGSLSAQAADTTGPVATSVERAMAFDPSVVRIFGASRYATSAAIALDAFDSGVDVMYVSTGENYADALSAGAAAAHQGGGLILVKPDVIPSEVASALDSLNPDKIVVVGGVNAVSAAVYTALDEYTDNLRRDSGPDRYATSIAINDAVWTTTTYAWVATGENFPDALSASAAAHQNGAPVILVPGNAAALPSAISTFIGPGAGHLQVSNLKVAGGTSTISPTIFSALDAITGVNTITRLAGANRYETSVAINANVFPAHSVSTVLFATGASFADALAGGASASHYNAPLYTVQPNCVPAGTLAALHALGDEITQIALLGGTATLSNNVANLVSC